MNQLWRNSSVTGVELFLESCAFYLVIRLITNGLGQSGAGLSIWLVFLVILWAYVLSLYIQTMKFTANLRGLVGLGITAVSILILAHLQTGMGLLPVGAFVGASFDTVATQVMVYAFLVLLWWRGTTIAQDEVTLDSVRSSFQWGLIVLFAAVLIDTVTEADLVGGFLVMGYFGVGLAGMALARYSSETSDSQIMSFEWWLPIMVSVGGVLILGLIISAIGLGGLDDVTRLLLNVIGDIGFWVIKPLLLGLGYIAGALVAVGNWLSGMFGGGDLSGLARAQEQIRQFHETMQQEAGEDGPPAAFIFILKFLGFTLGVSIAGWIIYRIFKFRRLHQGPGAVEETRESVFSWSQANQDLSDLLSDWWNKWMPGRAKGKMIPDPQNPREVYHALLDLSEESGRAREKWQTPREHEGTLSGLFPLDPVDRIVDGFQHVYYGESEATAPEIEGLRADWTAINQHLQEMNRREQGREGQPED